MRTLHVLIIHANHLTYRKTFLLKTLKLIEELCTKKAYVCVPHYINEYEIYDVKSQLKNIEKQLEKYEGDDKDFKYDTINIEQLSNFLKQRRAVEKIIEMDDGNVENYYMILEDDCVIIPEFIKNFEELLENPKISPWDILFLSMSNNADTYEFRETRSNVKILPSKDIYCITPECAKRILPSLQKIMGIYRVQLSYIIHTNKDIISMYSSKNISIEGSKTGFFPSAVIENNILIHNRIFIELFTLFQKGDTIDMNTVDKHYNMVEHLESPEIMHIYGVLLYKNHDYHKAKTMFEKAIDQMILKNGILNKRSELLNNAITINSLCQ